MVLGFIYLIKSNNNRKKTSLASKSSTLHKKYGGVQIGEYQHDIKRAYPEYIMEESENVEPPVSKHPKRRSSRT